MKLSTYKILAAIATLSILVAAGIIAFVYLVSDKNSDTLADAATLANGTDQDYFIWCDPRQGTRSGCGVHAGGVFSHWHRRVWAQVSIRLLAR